MTRFGNAGLRMALVIFALLSGPVYGALTAQMDRTQIALGDSARLTLSATEDEDLNTIDLSMLEQDFEILRRSSSNNISIINGKRTHERKLVIDLTPRREGDLVVPSFRLGSSATQPLRIRVSPQPELNAGSNPVLFSVELDKEDVFVQSQLLLTLRIQRSIELESMSLSELEIDNAFVKPLETKEFYRTIDGRNWLVHEVRYAIFPEQSGELQIPTQIFSARAADGRRSIFSRGTGRLVRRSTNPLTVNVLPRPANYSATTWLPAQQVKIEERWSTPPETLRAGESATRTLTIIGEGVQGAQLPPVLYTPSDGLKFYPDQPEITEQEVSSGLLGSRRDSTAIVPTRPGEWTLPEVRIPWWDTTTKQMRFATLPARTLSVGQATGSNPANPVATNLSADPLAATPAANAGGSWLWPVLFAFAAAGWLATLAYLWRTRRVEQPPREQIPNASERKQYRALEAACTSSEAGNARNALIRWAAAFHTNPAVNTLDGATALFDDSALREAAQELDAALYRGVDQAWSGEALLEHVNRLRAQKRDPDNSASPSLALYPDAR